MHRGSTREPGQLTDALESLCLDGQAADLPGGRLPAETEGLVLAEQRRCQLAAALIDRLKVRVQPELRRLRAERASHEPAAMREQPP